jgi:uncharacterized paraquat-inducible protein A
VNAHGVTDVSQSPRLGGKVRRRPRSPRLASALLVVWLLVLSAGLGMFVYWIRVEAWENGQPRLGVGGLITIAVLLLNWVLLIWRARILSRLDAKVKAARGAVCLNCHSVLTREGQEGICPACEESFELSHLRRVWKLHVP